MPLEKLAFGEVADESEVGGEEVVFLQVAELDPAHLVEDLVLDFAGELPDSEELQVHGAAVTVIVANTDDGGAYDGLDAQFFLKLADQRLLRTFAGLDFSAGKFPFERHNLIGTPLTNENLAVTKDKSGRYKSKRRTRLMRRRGRLGVHRSSVTPLKRM